ncbi:hypothetical protein LT85_0976 [Collimonas arenae]|uniref:Uncharacterized protein n=2 Tax=Collimonas arenae TaxID=279058 RepID=A0A0A1F8X3_9BURK|nr:hypothetical protein LT85_0976 [Collimonas arenae]
MGHFDAEKIAVQCFAFSGFVQDALEEVLDVPLTYTLGFVKLGNKPIFYTSMEGLKEMLDAGRPATATLNLHAWLTLPSDEIIDVTFGTTLGVLRNEPEMIGRIATIHPDDMVGEHSYHPQLLGDDFLRRIGVLVEL